MEKLKIEEIATKLEQINDIQDSADDIINDALFYVTESLEVDENDLYYDVDDSGEDESIEVMGYEGMIENTGLDKVVDRNDFDSDDDYYEFCYDNYLKELVEDLYYSKLSDFISRQEEAIKLTVLEKYDVTEDEVDEWIGRLCIVEGYMLDKIGGVEFEGIEAIDYEKNLEESDIKIDKKYKNYFLKEIRKKKIEKII